MKTAIAIDSFKGSLSSLEAGRAAAEGAKRACGAESVVVPLADGGEGTMEALVSCRNGQYHQVTVTGPLGDPVVCTYGILPESQTAILEIAEAAGLTLVPRAKLDPLGTTTYGVGEAIRDAIGKGCRNFIVGIGGSATNDGGAGMLQALGFDLFRQDGSPIPLGAKGLAELAGISKENVPAELSECSFRIACDVKNPLCGETGCSAIYGPQKGATAETIPLMDSWLEHFAALATEVNSMASPDLPGAGAGGGLGFAFLAFTNAKLEPGIQIVLEETGLEAIIRDSDIVVTGEGRLDAQTVMGKAPSGVASLAKKYGKPVVAFAGCVTEDATQCNNHGIDAFFPILRTVTTLDAALDKETARKNLTAVSEQVFRLIARFSQE